MLSLTANPGTLREKNLVDLAEDEPEFLYLVVTVGLWLKHFPGILENLIVAQTFLIDVRNTEFVLNERVVNHCNNIVTLPIINSGHS